MSAARSRPPLRRGLALVAAALTIVFAQFPVVLLAVTVDPIWFYRVQLFLADVPLAAAGILALPDLAQAVQQRSVRWTTAFALATVALLFLALAVHPSLIGLQTVLRVAAGLGLAAVVARASAADRLVLAGSLGVAGAIQTVLALAQWIQGRPLGLPVLGEFADPLLAVGSALAPRGTMEHPYVLAMLALLSAGVLIERSLWLSSWKAWLCAAAFVAIPAGLTFSRAAALAVAMGAAALLLAGLRGSARHRWAAVALLVGAGVPGLIASEGWFTRADQTIPGETVASAGRDPRGILIQQAFRLMSDDLVFGIGPGLTAERTRELQATGPGTVVIATPVHLVPLLVASEAGVLAGVTTTLLFLALGARAARSGTLVLYVLFIPFVLFEAIPYVRLQGAVMLAVWAGVIHGWDDRMQPVAPDGTGRESLPLPPFQISRG